MTPQDLIASFAVLAEAPGGIDRLRELVLQLAVRGKLVAQDMADEPASVLLERIKGEKDRLVREKNIRKPRPIPSWEASDQPFDVPRGWAWIRAEHALEFVTSGSRGWAKYYSDSGAIFLRIGNLDYETTDLDLDPARVQRVSPPASAEGRRTSTRPGDLLVSITGDTGMVGLVPDGLGEAYINQHIALARPVDVSVSRFLALQLSSLMVRTQLWGAQRGIKNSLGLNDIRHLLLAVPPLAEQHRIVAKVDALMAHLDRLEAARDAREATRAQLRDAALAALQDADDAEEVEAAWARIAEHMDDLFTDPADVGPLRQTILQLAVRGRLVPQDPGDEPARVLLERIKAEKDRLVREKMIRKRRKLEPLDEADLPFKIPEHWHWCRMEDLVFMVGDGPHYSPQYVAENIGVPFLSTRNITPDGFRLEDLKYVSRDDHMDFCKRVKAEKGDILYTKGGTTGIALVNDLDFEFSVWVHVAILKLATEHLVSRYVELALNSPHCYLQSQFYTHGIGNKDLGLTRMVKISVPLPPLAEQHRIVAKVDSLMAHLDRLETRLTSARDACSTFAASAVHHVDA